ncbi:hypothetical protein IAQ61_004516 [Plenodomus lingam]|uniref:Nucleolar protein 12 n=1 Tax=Leptosphaeria maculans (strain JN3 / isolate v23.1.3 / race Av1-4-5-6-7-8) TaxID=985895 RepID=E4ZVR0_LEPMJ|nr:similar to nucleolar protein 12 [Plenodomus lingam JN3]KAH9873889.1 hypothetical protein IAQ61_004516 [Plenodomus lingam]CBX95686.1 similar to nucleolar protein 12 [Plenodomus lingam JN3]
MGKPNGKTNIKRPAKTASSPMKNNANSLISVDRTAFDPTLASLFETSAGPVQAPPKSRYKDLVPAKPSKPCQGAENDEELSSASEGLPSDDDDENAEEDEEHSDEDSAVDSAVDDIDSDDASSMHGTDAEHLENEAAVARMHVSARRGALEKQPSNKRKRTGEEEIEDTYMRKVAREEEKEEEQRQKKRKTKTAALPAKDDASDRSDRIEQPLAVPQHESLIGTTDKESSEVEKASRTVFLSNVSSECINSKAAEKALRKHLESFLVDLADNNPPHKIESIRFRSTAFASSLPKRAAFAKKEIMDSTTKSTNAYAVYTTKVAAREAVKRLNGTLLLDRHLHVDSVAHPAKVDHRRCVFVGNLPFVDDREPASTDEKPKKPRPSSDVEEGLWVHFAKAGKIESVRVVRDAQTRIGKGFAYVQFVDENGVEAALQLNEKKFPPLLPRILRVTRCKAEKKKDKTRAPPPTKLLRPGAKGGYVAKLTGEQKSMQGRARSMLGKVAKAQTKEGFIFEGHRASEKQGKGGLKFKGSGGAKKKGPNGRKSRSATWKKTGAKK